MVKTRLYDSDMSRRKSYVLVVQGRLSVLFYVNYNDYILLEINKRVNYISSFRYITIITESYKDILNGILKLYTSSPHIIRNREIRFGV